MSTKTFINSKKLLSLLFVALAFLMIFALTIRPMTALADDDTPAGVFSNASPIAINTVPAPPTVASPYPSNISVSGMTGTIAKITVTLNNLNHPHPDDIDILLVSPTGGKYIIMSDALTFPTNNFNLTLDTTVGTTLPQFQGFTGATSTFRAANYVQGGENVDVFPAPAPAPPYNSPFNTGTATFATVFNGGDPNGTWSLYVTDDTALNSGSIAGGWSLNVTTNISAATTFTNGTTININDVTTVSAAATPYPSTINVTGQTGVVSNLKVTLTGINHTRPEDIDVLLVSPNGATLVLMSDVGNGNTFSNTTLTLDDAAGSIIPSGGIIPSGPYKPTNFFGNDGFEQFPAPAPPLPYGQPPLTGNATLLSALGGYSPNGTWSLYVMDDREGESGTISGGWSLDITTAPYVPPTIGCAFPSFASTSNVAAGSSPTGIAAADFNNDARQDLVVTNQGANTVSVMLGDGVGGFAAATDFPTGTSPYSVAVGLFNNDANQDLVVVNSGSNNVSILLGNGAGGFSAPTGFPVGLNPIHVAVGQFNGDTNLDLAVANFGGFFAGTVSVLLGTGTGTFGPATNFGVRTQPSFVAVGQFNGDTNLDLAVANFGSNNISILTGNGLGAFTAAPNVNVGTGPVSIAIGDYNSDGKSDLAAANYNSDNISVVFGNGAALFTPGSTFSAGTNPISIVTADFSGDGKLDLAVANSGSNNVKVVLGNGSGAFSLGIGQGSIAVGSGPNSLVVGEFNGNSAPDLATANSSSNNVSVLLNGCVVAKGNRVDFDADRRTDLGVFRPGNTTWYILLSSSNNTGFTQTIFGSATDRLVPEDYNGDGVTDLGYFRPSTGVWVVPGIYFLEFGISTDTPVPADYDGDGRADLAVFRPSDGTWYIRRSTDNLWLTIPFGTNGDKPVPRDYDGDSKADVAVFRPSTGTWYIMNSSNGQVVGQPFGITEDRPVPADYDGDEKADLAVFRPSNGIWYIMRSSDSSVTGISWGVSTDIPVPGDYDGEGKFDVAVWRPGNGYWYVRRSSDGALLAQPWGTNGDIPLPSVYVP